MKSFRSIGLALAGLAIACFGIVAALAAPLVQLVTSGIDAMACGVEKLKRELASGFGESVQMATGVGAGLTPEGHGFRQTSASDLGAQRTPLSI